MKDTNFAMWELTKSFTFEAAHSLPKTTLGAASQEIHGHSFRAEVTVRGTPDEATGMVVDFGLPTLENLARYIYERVQHTGDVTKVSVHRDSCHETCTYFGPQG